jgi:hypothetical protein
MAKCVAKLFANELRNLDGSPIECVIAAARSVMCTKRLHARAS